ncbi:invasion associated locus B family protein [Methylobacterium sp. J-067]|uniref:invasion associated locus B family protein n=1 Tax=Methylobacterium sp. J-067 TaxID=2836648 RepID=UPI001FB8D319|nr:invasion associated locus B family protein [Methylobacterium sp. J-067]MCJ2027716.1 invasion associated locus B family protein [Methylobacterium sp. J-067]
MPPIRLPVRRAALLVAVLLSATAARAQDADPAAESPPAAGSAAAPKARPKPKPAPKPAAKPAPTPAAATPAAPVAAWPTGATTVSESYGDWTVSCVRPDAKVTCIVVQSQGDSKTGRRQFGFELSVPKDGRSEGVILMPFGMAIEPGVTFKLDEQALGKGAPYSTCTSDGCLVPISFPTLATDGMRNAKSLTIAAQKSGNNEPATIVVPLVGFPQAFDRAVALSG